MSPMAMVRPGIRWFGTWLPTLETTVGQVAAMRGSQVNQISIRLSAITGPPKCDGSTSAEGRLRSLPVPQVGLSLMMRPGAEVMDENVA